MSTTPQYGHHHSHHTHVHGHHTGPTHEPNVNEAFAYHYDAATVTFLYNIISYSIFQKSKPDHLCINSMINGLNV